jgi:hypothetical protein
MSPTRVDPALYPTIPADPRPSEKRYITALQQIFEWFFLHENTGRAYVSLPFPLDSTHDEEFNTLKLLYEAMQTEWEDGILADIESVIDSSPTVASVKHEPEAALYSHALFVVLSWCNPAIIRPDMRKGLEESIGRKRFALMLLRRDQWKHAEYAWEHFGASVPYIDTPQSLTHEDPDKATKEENDLVAVIMEHVVHKRGDPGFLEEKDANQKHPEFAK